MSSQFKLCRRIGENVWQTKKLSSMQRQLLWKSRFKAARKQSDFAKQLQQRTKLSVFYGGLTKARLQHASSFKQAARLSKLETRLDVILVRIHFCASLFEARQWISHQKVYVNSQPTNLAGFPVSKGDLISLSPTHQHIYVQKDSCKFEASIAHHHRHVKHTHFAHISGAPWAQLPSHLEVNYKTCQAVLLYEPLQIVFPYKIDLDLL